MSTKHAEERLEAIREELAAEDLHPLQRDKLEAERGALLLELRPKLRRSEMRRSEKVAFIRAHGQEAFLSLPA